MGASSSTESANPREAPPAELPSTMKSVQLVNRPSNILGGASELSQCFEVKEVPMPTPGSGEVLVKMHYSPINVSDVSLIKGAYNCHPGAKDQPASSSDFQSSSSNDYDLPCKLGFEGSGVVVQNGGGISGWLVSGKRVAIVSKSGGRTWAEYAVVPASTCVSLPDDISSLEGSSLFINPMTALAFLEITQYHEAKGVIVTAAASSLGKMCLRLFRNAGIRAIAVVRHHENADSIRMEVADDTVCVVTDEPEWGSDLRAKIDGINATLLFDCVGGPIFGQVLSMMPNRSIAYVYGALSGESLGVNIDSLIFQQKRIEGFWLNPYVMSKNMLSQKNFTDRAIGLLKTDLRTKFKTVYPLHQLGDALADYLRDMTAGKIVISPLVTTSTGADEMLRTQAAQAHEHSYAFSQDASAAPVPPPRERGYDAITQPGAQPVPGAPVAGNVRHVGLLDRPVYTGTGYTGTGTGYTGTGTSYTGTGTTVDTSASSAPYGATALRTPPVVIPDQALSSSDYPAPVAPNLMAPGVPATAPVSVPPRPVDRADKY